MTRLALVMIVRDEAPSIARALRSARPHVDRMIVLDTGSTDGTQALATAEGAEVSSYDWTQDFAAARNASLALSDAAWNLVLDADEWIEGGTDCLGPTTLPPSGGDFMGEIRRDNHLDQPGSEGAAVTWIPRILPRGVRYEGRIHEQPVGVSRGLRLPLRLGHDGFTTANLARKGDRNEALLMLELQVAPDDPYLWFQLAKEHQVRDRAAQAALCFAEALRLAPADVPYRHALVVRALTALKAAGRLADALQLADAEVGAWPESPDFWFALGDLYLECATQEPDRALADYLPIVQSAWKRCLEIGERPQLDGTVAGRGSHMAAHNLAVFYEALGQTEPAARYHALAAQLRAGPTA
ncbi:MAG: glycosyltransferase [Alphaproteobacteria bacterium]|nr:glycosyltransferase [Alphaproteobacteria bacterium]MBU1513116.1 glycosyltransferase [Alphaproteobacteria bacterium]MBU2095224.1 glycosyltransferase [Alphaproteobacteria bacterium]MBU2150617.1 glycosyltransferase [Alphaproteobacteria bacterium]MBU2306124.1 glycosyltransferase [Alphaproteobacteria bacterium]